MTKIDPSLYLNNQPREAPSSSLGKEEFLKILMAQLKNQDPMNPMEDKEFISQMATFSSLEQMMNMSSSISQLVQNQTVSPVIQNSHLIDKEVTHYKINEETGEYISPKVEVNSTVVAVSQKQGEAILELASGNKIYTSEVLKINNPSTS
ncbi:flagellar hook assembly protein FlgD [Aquibacillus koreensis]|uniref:Flagellar hook assembly protein FlgD n=1 Tax=Aquibacillus koreensis TaxID=279446 RepID=A0A9X3WLG9_9BACI|nr:flagellar hook assembly protein FlgD [Aquibacillus koreensis]MCT2534526.1 flagellar hook assembly protein FlgD [Aquibacillus koreensis]MDC3421880.1 flagellar hook assembly protein FlgD [Aquibacillus koreensis]